MASDDLRCVLTLEYKYSSFAIYRDDGIVWQENIRTFDYRQLANYIANYIRHRYALVISEALAVRTFMEIGSLTPLSQERKYVIGGQNTASGFPGQVEINSTELQDQILIVFSSLVAGLRFLLEDDYSVEIRELGRISHNQPQVTRDLREEIEKTPIMIAGQYSKRSPFGLVAYLGKELGRKFMLQEHNDSKDDSQKVDQVEIPSNVGKGLRPILSLEQQFCSLTLFRDEEVIWSTNIRAFNIDSVVDYLVMYFHHEHFLLIGEPTAERLLWSIGSLLPLLQEQTYNIRGRNRVKGTPDSVEVSSIQVREPIRLVARSLVADLQYLLHQKVVEQIKVKPDIVFDLRPQVPENLRKEIADIPIQIIGEYSHLRGLPEYLSQELGREFFVEADRN